MKKFKEIIIGIAFCICIYMTIESEADNRRDIDDIVLARNL